MTTHAIFEKLVFDENDQPVGITQVGDEPCYVIDDQGFNRHIPSREVDLAVLRNMADLMQGHEDTLAGLAGKSLGTEDIFSLAMIVKQLKNIDTQFGRLLETGMPENVRAYLGMMGFKIFINIHGEVLDIIQPGISASDDDEPLD